MPRQPLADWHLWTDVTRTVSPLRRRPLVSMPASPERRAEPRSRSSSTQPSRPQPALPAPAPLPAVEPRRSIEPKLRRKVMRGRIEIDGTLDLHGMRQVEARSALIRFLSARYDRGDRTILVITGKGLKKVDGDSTRIVEKGVLRAMLPVWLSEPVLSPLVAGWDSAAPGHGGEGAFYVRLRRGGA